MDLTASLWVWVACLGGAGGAVSAWSAKRPAFQGSLSLPHQRRVRVREQSELSHVARGAAVAAATAAAMAWMIVDASAPSVWIETRAMPAAVAFFWIGFVTTGWLAAERDKRVLRKAVCRAATAPAAHPDTVEALAHASPDAIYAAVQDLVPHRVVH